MRLLLFFHLAIWLGIFAFVQDAHAAPKGMKKSQAKIDALAFRPLSASSPGTPLKPGTVINLNDFRDNGLEILALTSSDTAKVVYSWNNQEKIFHSSAPPFALTLVTREGENGLGVIPGTYDIAATAYNKSGQGATKSLRFRIVEGDVAKARSAEVKETELLETQSPTRAEKTTDGPQLSETQLKRASLAFPEKPSSSASGKCVGILGVGDTDFRELTVVCAHQIQDVRAARVFLSNQPKPVCEFSNTASPMIASCMLPKHARSALYDGKITVDIESTSQSATTLSVLAD